MKTLALYAALLTSLSVNTAHADSKTVNKLLQDYAAQGGINTDEKQGEKLWGKTFTQW